MKMLVLGADGATGRAVVDEALAAGHEVTAVAPAGSRTSAPHDRLDAVAGDPADQAVVQKAVLGQDVVVQAVQSVDRRPTSRYTDTLAAAVGALESAGDTKRLVCVSGQWTSSRGMPLGHKLYQDLIIHRRHHNPINDMLRMEQEVALTDLEWTVLRPTVLVDGPSTGRYRVSTDGPVPGGRRLTRGDLGLLIATGIEDPALVRATVSVAT